MKTGKHSCRSMHDATTSHEFSQSLLTMCFVIECGSLAATLIRGTMYIGHVIRKPHSGRQGNTTMWPLRTSACGCWKDIIKTAAIAKMSGIHQMALVGMKSRTLHGNRDTQRAYLFTTTLCGWSPEITWNRTSGNCVANRKINQE